jgi:hypothetical protein
MDVGFTFWIGNHRGDHSCLETVDTQGQTAIACNQLLSYLRYDRPKIITGLGRNHSVAAAIARTLEEHTRYERPTVYFDNRLSCNASIGERSARPGALAAVFREYQGEQPVVAVTCSHIIESYMRELEEAGAIMPAVRRHRPSVTAPWSYDIGAREIVRIDPLSRALNALS